MNKAKARAQKKRWQLRRAQISKPISGRVPDPLLHPQASALRRAGLGLLGLVAASITHVFFGGALWLVAAAVDRDAHGDSRTETVTFDVVEVPVTPPIEPETVEDPTSLAAPEAPAPKKEKRKPVAEPPPDPINQPETAPPASQKPVRIGGLDLGSTVSGTGGPRFATGNTRMTATRRVAERPDAVEALPPEKTNRVAAFVPSNQSELVKPKRLSRTKPPYPAQYKSQEIEDDVTVEIELSGAGRVLSVRLVRPSRFEAFNRVARETAKKERFAPATRDGKPIPFRLSFTYRFRLTE